MSVTFGVYMIVKNEEKYIKRGISSFLKCSDEIVVVDTGSSDKTIDEIKSINDDRIKLYTIEWPFDFSKARNHAMSLTTSDFVLSMDGDEYFDDKLIETLLKLKNNNFNNCNYVKLNLENFSEGKSYGIRHGERVIVSKEVKPQYRYCVHEKIYCENPITIYDMQLSEGRIIHTHDGNLWGAFDTYRQMYFADLNNGQQSNYNYGSHFYYYLYYTVSGIDRILCLQSLSKCYSYKANINDYDFRLELRRNKVISDNEFIALAFVNLSNPSQDDICLISMFFNELDPQSNAFWIMSDYIIHNLNIGWLDSTLERMFDSYCLFLYQNMRIIDYIKYTNEFIKRFPNNKYAKNNYNWNKSTLIPKIENSLCVIHENKYSPSVVFYATKIFENVIVVNDGQSHVYSYNGLPNIKHVTYDSDVHAYMCERGLGTMIDINPTKNLYMNDFSSIVNLLFGVSEYQMEGVEIIQ